MVSEVVMSVLSDNSNRHITIVQAVQEATADGKNGKAAKEKDASKPKRQSKPRKGRTDVHFVRRLVRNERYNNLPIFQFIRMSYEK